MKKEYFNEKNGLWYDLGEGGIYYPKIKLNNENYKLIGRFGRMRKRYLEENHSALFNHLLLSEKLNEHLYKVDVSANAMIEEMMPKYIKHFKITNELKRNN